MLPSFLAGAQNILNHAPLRLRSGMGFGFAARRSGCLHTRRRAREFSPQANIPMPPNDGTSRTSSPTVSAGASPRPANADSRGRLSLQILCAFPRRNFPQKPCNLPDFYYFTDNIKRPSCLFTQRSSFNFCSSQQIIEGHAKIVCKSY